MKNHELTEKRIREIVREGIIKRERERIKQKMAFWAELNEMTTKALKGTKGGLKFSRFSSQFS
jgi:hypothetical protein